MSSQNGGQGSRQLPSVCCALDGKEASGQAVDGLGDGWDQGQLHGGTGMMMGNSLLVLHVPLHPHAQHSALFGKALPQACSTAPQRPADGLIGGVGSGDGLSCPEGQWDSPTGQRPE